MFEKMKYDLANKLYNLEEQGLYKQERIITSPQGSRISVGTGKPVLNFCSNNYLGLSNHPDVIHAAKNAMDQWGYGLSLVRFICGTQEQHVDLERKISEFLGTEDTLLYAACFDANGGLFEPLLCDSDGIISDELNHASIIDGVRLCKVKRFRYKHSDMRDLEHCLCDARNTRYHLICTDGDPPWTETLHSSREYASWGSGMRPWS
jgi:glycine C-acetyltransferase